MICRFELVVSCNRHRHGACPVYNNRHGTIVVPQIITVETVFFCNLVSRKFVTPAPQNDPIFAPTGKHTLGLCDQFVVTTKLWSALLHIHG